MDPWNVRMRPGWESLGKSPRCRTGSQAKTSECQRGPVGGWRVLQPGLCSQSRGPIMHRESRALGF